MKISAKLSYLRISPRKVRLLADMVRGKSLGDARTSLNFAIKKGSLPLLKLLNQATANARDNFQLEPDSLYISEIRVDDGPKYKRWRARSRGQAYEIQKKTCHISLTLEGKAVKGEKKETEKKLSENKNSFKPTVNKPKPGKIDATSGLKSGKDQVVGSRKPFRRKVFN